MKSTSVFALVLVVIAASALQTPSLFAAENRVYHLALAPNEILEGQKEILNSVEKKISPYRKNKFVRVPAYLIYSILPYMAAAKIGYEIHKVEQSRAEDARHGGDEEVQRYASQTGTLLHFVTVGGVFAVLDYGFRPFFEKGVQFVEKKVNYYLPSRLTSSEAELLETVRAKILERAKAICSSSDYSKLEEAPHFFGTFEKVYLSREMFDRGLVQLDSLPVQLEAGEYYVFTELACP